jgi:hypothetical protein
VKTPTADRSPGAENRALRRIKTTAALIAAAGAAAAGALRGPMAALSLTIGAVIVIFNFYVLERVTGRLITPRTGRRFSDFAVPAGGILSLLVLLGGILRWGQFDVVAGLAGLSVIVAAIAIEGIRGFWR